MLHEIVMAGFGGQGVISMGQLLTYAGMFEDRKVSWIPSYGPEMRGGTANCTVIISDDEIGSPVVADPTAVIAMNLPALDKFGPKVRKGGLLFVNSSLIEKKLDRNDITIYEIPANEIAEKIGNARIANMVMLGAFIAATDAVKIDSVLEALKKVLSPEKHKLIPLNKEALEQGAACVKK